MSDTLLQKLLAKKPISSTRSVRIVHQCTTAIASGEARKVHRSNDFSVPRSSGKWILEVTPVTLLNAVAHMAAQLCLLDSTVRSIWISYQITIIYEENLKPMLYAEERVKLFRRGDKGLQHISKLDNIMHQKILLGTAGTFRTICRIVEHKGENIAEVYNVNDDILEVGSLAADLLRELSLKPADVSFRCKGGNLIDVHSDLLQKRSDVFCKILTTKYDESTSNIKEICCDEYDEATVKLMVHFLYTDKLHESYRDVAVDLLVIADKYALFKLQRICEFVICTEILNTRNAVDMLCIADATNSHNLKEHAVDFIAANFTETLSVTKDWRIIIGKNFTLLADLLSALHCENVIFKNKTRDITTCVEIDTANTPSKRRRQV